MKTLFLKQNVDYLSNEGVPIDKRIVRSINSNKLPSLDMLISFSNKTGISINDFLFVEIAKTRTLR